MEPHVPFTQFAQSTPLFTLREIRDRYGKGNQSRSILNMLHRLKQQGRVRQLTKGVYAIAFSFPVVPKGKARIRTQVSAAHSREDLEFAVAKFAEAKSELGI